ncbi:hypothetical protein R9C00_20180 [Flammeovirgaceae bacterium SG7u.111]|nr:hypothetical protein [Flammeovirgaceae bacterium SG7u.132]WPO34020.1 hypothetical protein R9C00_20180 [Flammeovirgaceae bacterium SG7u.111]
MKKFLSRTGLYIILSLLFIELMSFLVLKSGLYTYDYPGHEIYDAIAKSKKKNPAKKVLIGDSVGMQLFPNHAKNDSVNYLTSNQSISMVGQYILLKNHLEAGNEIDTLFMLFSPLVFDNNLDQNFTYHYFLKPFDKPQYQPLFTETVKQQIAKIPYSNFSQVPHILVTSWAPNFTSTDSLDFTFLSPISVEYLSKIKELSEKNGFDIVILPAPVSNAKKGLVEQLDKSEAIECGMETEFNSYFDELFYLDSTLFSDGTHLIKPEEYSEYYLKNYF